MSVKLRFRRMGRKKLPVYGLVATDSRSPRDGRFIEDLGRYAPVAEPATVSINADRVLYWLSQGAQPSHTVRNLLQKEGVLLRWALTRQGKEAEEIETAVEEFKARRAEKKATTGKKTRAERRAEALEAERRAAKEQAAELAKERAAREAELRAQREAAEAEERAAAEAARAEAAAAAADSEALTEAADAPAPAAEAAPEAVAEAAPEAAEEQPAAEAETTEAVADEAGAAVAEQTDAAAEEAETAAGAPAETAPAAEATEADPDEISATPAGDPDQVSGRSVDQALDAALPVADTVTPPAEPAPTEEAPAEEAPAEEAEPVAEAAPAAEEAPAAEPEAAEEAPAAKADKLTTVSGIGPKYSGILTDAGITTFAALAETSVERLQEIIHEAGSTTAGNEETWPTQAGFLAADDTDGLEAYLESLK